MRRASFVRNLSAMLLAFCSALAYAGGPRFVAGSSYFDPSLAGQPVVWASGSVSYFVDQGSLSATVDNATATATVAAAAAVWSSVPAAAVLIKQSGSLAENVSGANVIVTASGLTLPADIQSSAISTPVAIIFDADGSVIDAFYGSNASNPDDCLNFGVLSIVDNLTSGGHIAHALILVNGLCAQTVPQLRQIQFQLTRAFGRILGLDWSQANDSILSGQGTPSLQQLEGWPLMRPVDINCNQLSVECIPNPSALRFDDTSALSRLYPVTSSNQVQYPGKILSAPSTLSIHGVVNFRRGQGMQGVNVVARPLTPGGALDDRYPVAAVSGFLFAGDRDNAVTGATNASGDTLPLYGSTDVTVQGYYDLSGIPLPPGETQADYQITLEPVNPIYSGSISVGPYMLGSPTPSGTLPALTLHNLAAGMSVEQDFTIQDSAGDEQSGNAGTQSVPALVPLGGEWQSRIETAGVSPWFLVPVQAGRHFTIEAQALDENGLPTQNKVRSVLGIWNASDAISSLPVNATIDPFNGANLGATSLAVDSIADGQLLLAIADQRGDGRPDYVFHGRLLYVNTVWPQHLALTGGVFTINGSGFRQGAVVSIGSQIRATTLEVTPTVIVALAPPTSNPTGSLDLVVTDPQTNGVAALAGGISYGDASNDTISIAIAPPLTSGEGVALPFSVRVFDPDQTTPIGGVPVAFSTVSGFASFNGRASPCILTTTGDGYASAMVSATQAGLIKLQASLSTGAYVDTEFTSAAPPLLSPATSPLFLAPEATWQWMPQVQAWNGSAPFAGLLVNWSGQTDLFTVATSSLTNSSGIANISLSLGPWSPGTSFSLTACADISSLCVTLPVFVVHPETEQLSPVSGTQQQLQIGGMPAPVAVRVTAPAGEPVAGGTVIFTGELRAWSAACPTGGPCPIGRLISSFSQSVTSQGDGSVSFSPALSANTAERLTGVAVAGSSSSVPFEIEIHP